jgi:hypothetical protein
MFTRDDYGRGRRFPLLWVFGPLVLGALLITGLGIAARATQGFPNIELAEELESAAGVGSPMLADETDFTWDRVCVFRQSASVEEVDETLGFEWGVIGGDPLGDGRLLLVFVQDDEVATHLYLRRGLLDPPDGEGDCRDADVERTRLSAPADGGDM